MLYEYVGLSHYEEIVKATCKEEAMEKVWRNIMSNLDKTGFTDLSVLSDYDLEIYDVTDFGDGEYEVFVSCLCWAYEHEDDTGFDTSALPLGGSYGWSVIDWSCEDIDDEDDYAEVA